MKTASITQLERRSLGRFDTPRPLAQALIDWSIQYPTDVVLEPSCGGGVIVKSAIARLKELGVKNPANQIWACDIDKRALAETMRSVAPDAPKLIERNFLSTTLSSFGNNKFNAIIGNPPYVRLHAMDTETRRIARSSLPDNQIVGARASLWAYFPIHAHKLLANGGRMGWILPETILHSEYGKQVFHWAKQKFAKCIAVSLRERCFVADGAKERVVILLLDGVAVERSSEIEMIEFSSASECIEALPKLAHPRAPALPRINGHVVPHLISDAATEAAQILEKVSDVKRFGDFAEIKIGVVTGNNDFFVLNKEQCSRAKLGARHFRRVVSKFANLGYGFRLSPEKTDFSPKSRQERSWMLCPNPRSQDPRLIKYLATYPREEIAGNKTMGKRAHWFIPELGATPDAFFQYMGKSGPRMVLNEAGYYCTNTIHRILFLKGVTQKNRRAICLSLHSTYSQLSAEFEGRQYGSGVLKLEPSEVRRLAFPMTESLAIALSKAWPRLTKEAATASWEEIIGRIDALVVIHCPILAKELPIEKARDLLTKVQRRRNSVHLGTAQ